MNKQSVSIRLIGKIMVAFLLITLLMGVSYVFMTFYFTTKYFEETTQKLNAQVADHLIQEKFQNATPFLADGAVNKPLFGDIMHDMMAVNRGIEVYLLDQDGEVLYSVVLDHSQPDAPATRVDLAPIQTFIETKGEKHILGEDPRNPARKKIFSAAAFDIEGHQGYIYIILASQRFEEVTTSLIGSYYLKLGLGGALATILFAGLIGLLAIWYLTRTLRQIIDTVRRFKEGDLQARVPEPNRTDLSVLAETYNNMADTIVANIDELKSVEALRRELIANISHDLRTPLSIMQGYIETLQIKKDSLSEADRDRFLEIVHRSTEKLSHLIYQLFEYSKLEARQIEPQKEPFPISDLAHDVYEKYQHLAEAKGISIQLEIESKLPWVFADIGLVERVIQNLMDNALKFTPEGGSVTIVMASDDRAVSIAIRDTGPGIPEGELEHIFERYTKASTGQAANQGAGLGLAIVKKIIEIHESTIKVVSKPQQGTTFEFQLPAYSTG